MTTLLLIVSFAVAGLVEGRVTSVADGVPVRGAAVSIAAAGIRVRTDTAGRFRLADLAEGRWELRVEADGFEPRSLAVRVPASGTVSLDVELTPIPGPASGGARAPVGRVAGRVLQEEGGEPIPGARVEIVERRRSVDAGAGGGFAFEDVSAGVWTLRVSAAGYHVSERVVRVGPDVPARIDVALESRPLAVPGLTVEAWRPLTLEQLARIEAPAGQIVDTVAVARIPVAVERDVLRALQTLPSVTPSSDFSSALFVRGGTPDQTRIHLDGAPVHNPFHLGGFVSTFTPDATAGALLRAGGLPASAPSSLSGMVDIRTREGGRDSVRVRGSVGLLSSSATVDGPLPRGAGSFLLSGRRTYIDAATTAAAAVGLLADPFPYGFSDGLGKLVFDLGGRGRLTAAGWVDREAVVVEEGLDAEQVDGAWGSDALSLRLEGPLGGRLTGEAGLATSGFAGVFFRRDPLLFAGIPIEEAPDTSRSSASLRTFAADASLRAMVGAHLLMAGGRWESSLADHDFRPADGDERLVPVFDLGDRFGSTALYVRDRWTLDDGWTLDGGLRAERVHGRAGWRLLPRGRIERALGPAASLAVSAGRYVQPWWSLRNEESAVSGAVSYDVTVPAPTDRPLPESWDAVLEARMDVGGWRLRADAFVKRLSNVPTSLPSLDPLDEPVLRAPDEVRLGRGRIAGVEASATGRLLSVDLALAYRWQRERRTLGEATFTPRSERRHRLVVAGLREWGEREVAFAVTWMSGIPYTPPAALLPSVPAVGAGGRPSGSGPIGTGVLVFDAPNSATLPSYLRLDLDARGLWDLTLFGRRGTLQPYVSVLNVLNQHNALVAEHRGLGGRVLREVGPQLPVLPSLGLRWRF